MIALFNFLRTKTVNVLIICPVLIVGIFITISISEAKEYYKWKDAKGNTHVTDDIGKIPDKYRQDIEIYNEEKGNKAFKELDTYLQYLNSNKKTVAQVVGLLAVSVALYLLLFNTGEIIRRSYIRHRNKNRVKLYGQSGLADIKMGDLQKIIKEQYKKRGYSISEDETQFKSISFIAQRGNERIAVNINNNLNPVSRIFVNDLDSQKHKLGCNRLAVYTKNLFEEDVPELAKSVNCSVYDRYDLAGIVRDYSKFRNQSH